jgi:hypothetical protein
MFAQTLTKLGRTDSAIGVLRNGIATAEKGKDLHAAEEMRGLLDSLE